MYARAYKRPKRRRWTSIAPITLWLGLLIAFIAGAFYLISLNAGASSLTYLKPAISRQPATPTPTPTPAFVPLDVQARWQRIAEQYPKVTVSAELRDVRTGLTATMDASTPYRAASTTKMIAASYFLNQVEQDKRSLDEPLGNFTAKFQLQQMINQSNNNSWAAFLQLLGRTNEQRYAHQQGWASFNVTTNYIAPTDLADLLQQLWQEKLLNKDHTDYLLSLMQHTINEELIPPAVPAGAVVYHKYGWLEDDLHDAALITYKGRTYVLVIMSNGHGVMGYTQRRELFHSLVKAVFAPDSLPTPSPTPSP